MRKYFRTVAVITATLLPILATGGVPAAASIETQGYYSEQTVQCQQQSENLAVFVRPDGEGSGGGQGASEGTIVNGIYYSQGSQLPIQQDEIKISQALSDGLRWYDWDGTNAPTPVSGSVSTNSFEPVTSNFDFTDYQQTANGASAAESSAASTLEFNFGVEAYQSTAQNQTSGGTGVDIPYVNNTTACPNLPRAYTFTINGYPITVTNAAYSQNGESQIIGTGSVNPFQYVSDGSVAQFPGYTSSGSCPSSSGYTCSSGSSCPYASYGTACPYGSNGCQSSYDCLYGGSYFSGSSGCPTYTYSTDYYPTATGTGSSSNTASASSSIQAMEQASLSLLNAERQAAGLPALPMDSTLQQLARAKSEDMSANNYFSHTSPTYGSASQMLNAAGYQYRAVGENLAHYEDVYTANNALMSSTGHRANIMGSQWTRAGVGVALDANGYPLITQLFANTP